jgi:hypothetical protein
VPFNLVQNSSFENSDAITQWFALGADISLAPSEGINATTGIKMICNGQDPDKLIQRILLDSPLKGRSFTLSFHAKADKAVTTDGFLLKAPMTENTICRISAAITKQFQSFASSAETWPEDEIGHELMVVLAGTGDRGNPIYFDNIQVIEIGTRENLVGNGDFEEGMLDPWRITNGTLEKVLLSDVLEDYEEDEHCVKFTNQAINDFLFQKILFDKMNSIEPRHYVLSFYAKAAANNQRINGFLRALHAENETRICEISEVLSKDAFKLCSSAEETWPQDLQAMSFEIVISGSDTPGSPVYLDQVQVERATTRSRWDDGSVFRYENDLAPFKPGADVIVLGPAEPPNEQNGAWYAIMRTTNTHHEMTKLYDTATMQFPTKTIFGWNLRDDGEDGLRTQDGKFRDFDSTKMNPEDPNKMLPLDFNNRFFNGYDRLIENAPLPYLDQVDFLTILAEPIDENHSHQTEENSAGQKVYLPKASPKAILTKIDDQGQEIEDEIPLHLDTIVIESDLMNFMVIWRGCWQFDLTNKERYKKLVVSGGF